MNYKALIVEDDPVAQNILVRGLTQFGYEAVAYDDAESAWQHCCQDEFPRLVILDWLLPGMDGISFCRKIRGAEKGEYVTILMVTSQEDLSCMRQAIENGVDYYMVKPIVAHAMETWLSVAHKKVQSQLAAEKKDKRLARYRKALESANDQLKEAVDRANRMAFQSQLTNAELNQIFNNAAEGIRVIDKEGNVLRCNDTFVEFAGVPMEEVLAKKYNETFDCRKYYRPGSFWNGNPDDNKGRIEFKIEKKYTGGGNAYFNVTVAPFRSPDGDFLGIIEYIRDISSRVMAEAALRESENRYRELSILDELTNLYNKRHFNHHLRLEVHRSQRYQHPLSLLMADIDDFKFHNDTYGHMEGDRVLARLGELIKGAIRKNDLPCRYGGEEFAIILPETKGMSAVIVAERIRAAFAAENFYPSPDEKVHKTISIGVTEYQNGEDEETLVSRADQNLYQAKEMGKNRCFLE